VRGTTFPLGEFVDVLTMSSEQARRCGLYDIEMGHASIKKGENEDIDIKRVINAVKLGRKASPPPKA
jgi:hypothetical protein